MSASRFLECAIEAALAAGQLQRSRFDSTFSIDLKGAKDLPSKALIAEMTNMLTKEEQP